MKTFELKPTDENILNTYLSDSIGRNKEVLQFVNILNSIDGSCAIALEGKWGSGKTFFVKQVELVLNANNDFTSLLPKEKKGQIRKKQQLYLEPGQSIRPYVSVYYDSWANDSDDDPALSLVYTIMQTTSNDYSLVGRDYLDAGIRILDSFLGTQWTDIVESLKGDDALSQLKKDKTIEEKIKAFLAALLPEKGERLIVFVDELDRCSPSYAVRLLERIKHYFDNENITFVFSVNIDELQHTIKKFYGATFDGARYLDRFFDLRVQLPKVELENYYSQLNFSSQSSTWSIMCDAMIRKYNMQMRDISRYLQLYRLAVGKRLEKMETSRQHFLQSERYYCLMYVVPIMIALKLINPQKYSDFVEGKDPSPLIEAAEYLRIGFFSDLLEQNESYESAPANSGTKVVTLEEKMKAMYKGLFVTDYNLDWNPKCIGKARFNNDTRKIVEGVTGLLSTYAQYDD